MSEKKLIRREIFEDENFDFDGKPEEFLKFFQDKFAEIPEEFKDSGIITFEAKIGYYDDHATAVEIYYASPETDVEQKARLAREEDRKKFRENQELCELERLKAKYGV